MSRPEPCRSGLPPVRVFFSQFSNSSSEASAKEDHAPGGTIFVIRNPRPRFMASFDSR